MKAFIIVSAIIVAVAIMISGQSCENGTDPDYTEEALGTFNITAPNTVTTGASFPISVTAVGDKGTRPFKSFSGDVRLTLSDGLLTPGTITLTDGEGTGNVVPSCGGGAQTLTAHGGGKSGSIQVNTSLMDSIPGNPEDPVEEAIPEFDFAASGIFSSSGVLLDQSYLHRVPGAIQADTPNDPTTATYKCGGELTDIPEDFRINASLFVEIPAGATHLFIGVADCWYSDNTEDPAGYAVYLTAVPRGEY